ncbi:MAG: DUF448 domain-containing protein [Leptolyngbya sp.]|nr:MAG: DUF448 domain-containing protein [Leptolyngbya sp.]
MKPSYRRCVACRKVALKVDFWRVVRVYPSQVVQLDEGMGRSAYLCPQTECLKAAQKKNRLGKAVKAVISDSLYEELEKRLYKQEIQ